ncbi:MAG: hypothetical protein JW748_10090 [Anaerolineales bacterium]|nr:hypothetical protein [Anaerolineales bacterium]
MNSKKAVFAAGLVLFAASLACSNPITNYFSTKTAVMETATATMWTPTPTNTPTITPTPTSTSTPTATMTPTVDPRRYFETEGRADFSYIPPDGWRKLTVDGTDMRGWSGPGDTELGIFDMRWNDSAEDAAYEMASEFENIFDNYQEEGDGVLDLESGDDNAWFAFSGSLQGYKVFITMYFFVDGDGTAVYAMYFRTPDNDEDQDEVVLESMSSFQFED